MGDPSDYNCTLTGNSSTGEGGGACWGTLYNCTLIGNSAGFGGGTSGGTLYNCALTGNSSTGFGGGAAGGTLNNCTLTANSAQGGGGVYRATVKNCIVYFNTATNEANHYQDEYGGVFEYCCTTPLPTNGVGNITNAPLFVDLAGRNLRLQSNSPCINAGNNSYATAATDLDGNPRIVSGTVDIGSYEYQGTGSVISYAWLQQFGLSTDGSADYTDSDGDMMSNQQEWTADTNPTKAASCLRLTLTSSSPPIAVALLSSAGRLYTLQCCTNLTPSSVWTPVPGQTDLPGSGGVLTLTDTNPPVPAFYRVSVRLP
jgi:hypothetical protein